MTESNFRTFLREAIDEGLSSIGESGKEAVYFYLEKQFHLSIEESINQIGDFAEALERIFGLGANFLETLILRQLYEKLGKPFPSNTADQVDFVASLNAMRLGMNIKTEG